MRICLVSATLLEIHKIVEVLKETYIEYQPYHFIKGEKEIDVLITGVGMFQTVYGLTKYLQHHKPGICIQGGIAGAFAKELPVGTVCNVVEEIIADVGVEHEDGSFEDFFQLGLIKPNQTPFQSGKLLNPDASKMSFLPQVKSIATNTVSGTQETINKLIERYHPDIESMEGAGFFYTCLLENVAFMEIRSISNAVEVRDKTNWDIELAAENLNNVLIEIIESL